MILTKQTIILVNVGFGGYSGTDLTVWTSLAKDMHYGRIGLGVGMVNCNIISVRRLCL
jgi:hypothetical protein